MDAFQKLNLVPLYRSHTIFNNIRHKYHFITVCDSMHAMLCLSSDGIMARPGCLFGRWLLKQQACSMQQ